MYFRWSSWKTCQMRITFGFVTATIMCALLQGIKHRTCGLRNKRRHFGRMWRNFKNNCTMAKTIWHIRRSSPKLQPYSVSVNERHANVQTVVLTSNPEVLPMLLQTHIWILTFIASKWMTRCITSRGSSNPGKVHDTVVQLTNNIGLWKRE